MKPKSSSVNIQCPVSRICSWSSGFEGLQPHSSCYGIWKHKLVPQAQAYSTLHMLLSLMVIPWYWHLQFWNLQYKTNPAPSAMDFAGFFRNYNDATYHQASVFLHETCNLGISTTIEGASSPIASSLWSHIVPRINCSQWPLKSCSFLANKISTTWETFTHYQVWMPAWDAALAPFGLQILEADTEEITLQKILTWCLSLTNHSPS